MSKALFGHVGGPDPRMVSDENDALASGLGHDEDMLVLDREPALT
jgi:hypothetical protein